VGSVRAAEKDDLQVKHQWKLDANCRGLDPDMFLPHRGDTAGTTEAKAVCIECGVRRDCLDYGLMEKRGIWGGFTERERRSIRKARGLPEPIERSADSLVGLLKARKATEIPGKQSADQELRYG
jgi:WhiB family redox-sensing transcriptional regulator